MFIITGINIFPWGTHISNRDPYLCQGRNKITGLVDFSVLEIASVRGVLLTRQNKVTSDPVMIFVLPV